MFKFAFAFFYLFIFLCNEFLFHVYHFEILLIFLLTTVLHASLPDRRRLFGGVTLIVWRYSRISHVANWWAQRDSCTNWAMVTVRKSVDGHAGGRWATKRRWLLAHVCPWYCLIRRLMSVASFSHGLFHWLCGMRSPRFIRLKFEN